MAIFEALPVAGLFAAEDRLISTLLCSALIGGIGLVVRVGGPTGGMDIPLCILKKISRHPGRPLASVL